MDRRQHEGRLEAHLSVRGGVITPRLRLALAACACLSLAGTGCERDPPPAKPELRTQAALTYVGSAKCTDCHAGEAALWRESHHARAMQPADAQSVLGDFADAQYSRNGVDTTFFERDGSYWVRTDGADGELAAFRVAYTFGVTPLQQYLLELPRGRLQAFSIAWDSRPREQGGQRWFHLYGDEAIDPNDVLHWTGPAQNWNHMCAECHSTNVEKNYVAAEDRFATTWTDVNVGCEACHGPGSRHVEWASAAERSSDATRGLVFRLTDRSSARWAFSEGDPIAKRSTPLTDHVEVESCARCHARRAQLWPDYRHGQPLAQTHRVALLDEDLYYADGQIEDEVYEYGSFLQSRMYAQGVTCSDCHEPHSGQLRAAGNAVCAQCHETAHYDTTDHHRHANGTPAAQCVSCHMTERMYMVVDGRRDHSFRVPRPDLSHRLGTPNACNGCHSDRDAQWAADAVVQWFGPERRRGPAWAEALHAGRESAADAERLLLSALADPTLPAIARATAMTLLSPHLTRASLPAVVAGLGDADALVRRSALEALSAVDPPTRAIAAAPLLTDPVRTVRLEALGAMLDAPRDGLSEDQARGLEGDIAEYRRIQAFNADRADAQVNLGLLEARLGNADAALAAYERAIELQPSYSPAYVSLADLYRTQQQEPQAEATLRAALRIDPEDAQAREALGLTLVRQQRLNDALEELARAAELRPDMARYALVHAIALHEAGELNRAMDVLARAYDRHPADRDILLTLVDYSVQSGDHASARRWARVLAERMPDDPVIQDMLRQLSTTPQEGPGQSGGSDGDARARSARP
jgi:predicted CXXCH cytochrome family protein